MQPTLTSFSEPEQVLSPQNNYVGAGSICQHYLSLLVSTDATCLATQKLRVLSQPTSPPPYLGHLLELSQGAPPAHPTPPEDSCCLLQGSAE